MCCHGGWITDAQNEINSENITSLQQLRPGLPPEVLNDQSKIADAWMATNWSGVCDDLAKITKPTLVLLGTDDNVYVPSWKCFNPEAGKIPGAWLIWDPKCWSRSIESISRRDQ